MKFTTFSFGLLICILFTNIAGGQSPKLDSLLQAADHQKTDSSKINTLINLGWDVKDGMDISLVCFDFTTMKLEWAGANNPLYLLRAGEIHITKGDREPIGLTENPTPFTTHTFNLQKGDTIYLFTDGYADQFGGPARKKLGYKNFRNKLIELSTAEMNDQKTEIESFFRDWKEKEEQIDDV